MKPLPGRTSSDSVPVTSKKLERRARSRAQLRPSPGASAPSTPSDHYARRQRRKASKASLAAPKDEVRAETSAVATPLSPANDDVDPDIVKQLEDLLAIAKADKARGELADSSLSSWLISRSVLPKAQPPRKARTSAPEGSPQKHPDAHFNPVPRSNVEIVAKGVDNAPKPSSSRPARASEPGSAIVAHDLHPVDHQVNSIQGEAMWRDGRLGEPPRGGTGHLLETKPRHDENAAYTPTRSLFGAKPNPMLNPLYAPHTPQRSIGQFTYQSRLTGSPFGERLFSSTPAGPGQYRSRADFDSTGFWPIGGGGGGTYTSSSSESDEQCDRGYSESDYGSQDADLAPYEENEDDLFEGDRYREYGEYDDNYGHTSSQDGENGSENSYLSPSLDESHAQEDPGEGSLIADDSSYYTESSDDRTEPGHYDDGTYSQYADGQYDYDGQYDENGQYVDGLPENESDPSGEHLYDGEELAEGEYLPYEDGEYPAEDNEYPAEVEEYPVEDDEYTAEYGEYQDEYDEYPAEDEGYSDEEYDQYSAEESQSDQADDYDYDEYASQSGSEDEVDDDYDY